MRRGFVIWENLLQRLAREPELENIILGTGVMARDLQTKLRLLSLKAPFLVGGSDDAENGIYHYSHIAELEPAERYRFIVCFDVDEWTLIAPAQSAVYSRLGVATYNHPRVIRLTGDSTLYERAGEFLIDAHIQNLFIRRDSPYAVYGNPGSGQFNIHIFGGCHASALFRYSQSAWPELLQNRLRECEFHTVVYAWGQPRESTADCLLQFLRDGINHKVDLLILEKSVNELDVLHVARYNLLPVREGSGVHEYIYQLRGTYSGKIENGLKHNIDYTILWKTHHRVFSALAKRMGFTFWNIITSTGYSLPEEQARKLLGLSPGYLARKRKQKEAAISSVNGVCVKDYTDSFNGVDNIFEMYADISHLTDKGNEIIAERCAKDILQTFGERINNIDGGI
ncbi:MAG: hypothetical protein LBL26_00055 [Peptococcaceae bacterium]|jgi:hypothetical protein|nr:hypothetical protein [Peptococcaceae bacterium]